MRSQRHKCVRHCAIDCLHSHDRCGRRTHTNMNLMGDNMKQKWKPTQYVEISIHEIFAFQDRLDAVRDDPEKVWDVVDDFFMECENQLELSPNFLKELQEIDDSDSVPISLGKIDELFEDEDYESNFIAAQDYVNYILYVKNQSDEIDIRLEDFKRVKKFREDIPFVPRHDF